MRQFFARSATVCSILWLAALTFGQEPRLTIQVMAEISEAPRRIVHARLVIPVKPGPLTLVYPKWIPGTHSPCGSINSVVGLRLSVGGESIPWRRDSVDMYAFHCDVPQGMNQLEADLDFFVPTGYFLTTYTENLATLSWNTVLLYPKGCKPSEINPAECGD